MDNSKKNLIRGLKNVKFRILLNVISEKSSITAWQLVQINTENTTQKCSNCGNLAQEKIKLFQLLYHCWNYDLKLDRDVNSIINFLGLGFDQSSPLQNGNYLLK